MPTVLMVKNKQWILSRRLTCVSWSTVSKLLPGGSRAATGWAGLLVARADQAPGWVSSNKAHSTALSRHRLWSRFNLEPLSSRPTLLISPVLALGPLDSRAHLQSHGCSLPETAEHPNQEVLIRCSSLRSSEIQGNCSNGAKNIVIGNRTPVDLVNNNNHWKKQINRQKYKKGGTFIGFQSSNVCSVGIIRHSFFFWDILKKWNSAGIRTVYSEWRADEWIIMMLRDHFISPTKTVK